MNRQCDEIIRFMKDFGGITSAEAMADLGVYRLASRIHDIRKEGVKIKSETVTSKNVTARKSISRDIVWRKNDMAMNKVILCGRIAKDIELKQTNSGITVTQFSIALNKGDGKADFFSVVAWRNTAEFISKYFGKGDGICIDGHLTSRQYENDGAKHTVYEVVADNVSFSEGRRSSQSDVNIEGEQMHTKSNKSSPAPSAKQETASYRHPNNIGLAPDVNLPHLEEIAPNDDLPF